MFRDKRKRKWIIFGMLAVLFVTAFGMGDVACTRLEQQMGSGRSVIRENRETVIEAVGVVQPGNTIRNSIRRAAEIQGMKLTHMKRIVEVWLVTLLTVLTFAGMIYAVRWLWSAAICHIRTAQRHQTDYIHKKDGKKRQKPACKGVVWMTTSGM